MKQREGKQRNQKKTPQIPASRLVKSRAARGFVVLVVVEGRPPVYVAEVRPERGGGDEGEAAQATKMVIQSTFKFLPFLRDNKVGAGRDDAALCPVCPGCLPCLPALVREHDYHQHKHHQGKHLHRHHHTLRRGGRRGEDRAK